MGGRAFSFYGDDDGLPNHMTGDETLGGRAFSFYKNDDDSSSSFSEESEEEDHENLGGARRRRVSRKSRSSRSKSTGRKKLSRGLTLFNRVLFAIMKKKKCSYNEARNLAKAKFAKISRAHSAGTPYKKAIEASLGHVLAKKRRGSRRASRRGSRRGSRRR